MMAEARIVHREQVVLPRVVPASVAPKPRACWRPWSMPRPSWREPTP